MSSGARAEEAYRLGPQDELQVKVSDLRTGTGEAYQWQAFNNSKFAIAPSGRLSLPVIGEIDASGRTTAELEGVIGKRLQEKAGLAVKPDASVQIVKFRPFYIMGSVEKPGEYEYRPDLTVLQAVSIAGGLQRLTTDALLGYTREALSAHGDVRDLTNRRLALLAQQARLDAELKDGPLVFGGELASLPKTDRIIAQETQLFESRKAALQGQIVNLNQTKDFLKEQIVSLDAKDQNTGRQIDLIRQELDRITTLVNKGLSAMPRQVEVSQTMAQLESNRLDAQIAVIRARQDVAKADRDILELKDERRTKALQEATETRVKLAETDAKLETARNLLFQAETRAPAEILANADAFSQPDFVIFRKGPNNASTRLVVGDQEAVQPGDVVRVQPRSRARTQATGQTTGTTSAPAPVNVGSR
ncbi:polysaccharide biosynthesis/export family protein [Methylobacterium aerolatum]|uniref:Protein involved in polysaccharide export with SLBB domain n=1 Tax=Methylobacterium aerolatum TaxID=418708 RepID=A0ABU0I5S7_9HYPH|nr:polysaccharide biosynthesis/export family protein [Methylobacterium aerolatum]MDQ0449976.1 protein involved in polysaccharide export with SLBB domain [Methylobacterium aerolatum]